MRFRARSTKLQLMLFGAIIDTKLSSPDDSLYFIMSLAVFKIHESASA